MKEKSYMKISEFAKLRNVDLNSMRYYEKLGLLKPAYIDPLTKYRYYLPEQLPQLDTVLFAIACGMPLKELKQYIDKDGNIDSKRFMERGQELIENDINGLKTKLANIEHSLEYMRTTEEYKNTSAPYVRHIKRRRLVLSEKMPTDIPPQNIEMHGVKLFDYALKQNMSPVLPLGTIVSRQKDEQFVLLFFEVMNERAENENIKEIPEGDYLCLQCNIAPPAQMREVIRTNYGTATGVFLITNMLSDKLSFGNQHCEVQCLYK